MNKLKIVHVASEISPYIKTGGLADVVRSLPRALKRLGHQVIVIVPYYQTIKQGKFKLEKLNYQEEIILNGYSYPVRFYKTISSDKYPIFFIEQKKLFTSRHKIYGYPDDGLRFSLFNLATLKLLTLIKFKPQIIHCHDWQAGLIPNYLQISRRYQKLFKNTATLFTIHNLLWQGPFDWWRVPPEHKDNGQGLPSIKPKRNRWLNFTKRAILYADIINTVSERYAQEILTKKYGEGLDKYLRRRQTDVHGIINGIDYKIFNPLFDKNLYYCYDYDSLDKKNKNKTALQRKLSLKIGRDIPMIGIINRLTEQKGFELIIQITDYLLRDNLQIVVVGSGNKKYRDFFHKLAKKYPQQVAIITPFSEKMSRRVYAASDLY
ncbi:MAG: glycogen synthase, partial [Candidatus Aenigmarchaeota archaeon]|nr:glycogen synthase [Candidatus Aenigmarchaeota archaeon]